MWLPSLSPGGNDSLARVFGCYAAAPGSKIAASFSLIVAVIFRLATVSLVPINTSLHLRSQGKINFLG